MKKKLTLLILLFPFVLFAQTTIDKNGTITIDLNKKKKQQEDTTQKEQYTYPSDDEDEEYKPAPKAKKEKRESTQSIAADWKENGLFKGLFYAGFNGCQVDGDKEWGYKYFGGNFGIGSMIRFHQNFSVSLGFEYSMKGAKARYINNANNVQSVDFATMQMYRIQWDYIQIPLALNIQDKKLVMASVGLAPGYMIRYNERNCQGQDVTDNPPMGQPRRFDLSIFGGFGFIIKEHWFIGGKFEYSLLKIRGPENLSQYNNVLTFRVMYIMDKSSFKKK